MQAQKEMGTVCWGDLGKQEVSPWPNWPGYSQGAGSAPLQSIGLCHDSLEVVVLARTPLAARQLSNPLGIFFSFLLKCVT